MLGLRLHRICTPAGLTVTWALAPPQLDARQLLMCVLGPVLTIFHGCNSGWVDGRHVPGNPGDSTNCSDFSTQAPAQAWYEMYAFAYGDVAGLDGSDGDGRAVRAFPEVLMRWVLDPGGSVD